jgi:hypothetical protein
MTFHLHITPAPETIMAKGMNAKKNEKKKPQKTPAEKKAAKKEKKGK